jgi:mannose-6-phosphate isomerase-like protein (cupin superfamily)
VHDEPRSVRDTLFAAPLAGRMIESATASIVVAEWTDRGGGTDPPSYIAPLHIHRADDEAWYVIEGALGVRVGDEDIDVPAGGGVLVPRGTVHTFWNPAPGPTRYLLIMTPRIKRLIDLLHERTEMTPEEVAAAFREHDSEFLGWP